MASPQYSAGIKKLAEQIGWESKRIEAQAEERVAGVELPGVTGRGRAD